MGSTGQNSFGSGSKRNQREKLEGGLAGASVLADRICYPKHQSKKCEELVDSWQQISAQLMRWVICKEQSLCDSSQRIHFLSYTQFIATWESSNLTRLCLLFQEYINEEEFKKIVDFKILFTSHYPSLDMYFQHNPELDSSGRDKETFCPEFCCPRAATLITVSPSDLTLVFLLLACWLAECPGQLQGGTTAEIFTLTPTDGWKAHFILQDFKNVMSFTWKVKVDENAKMLLNMRSGRQLPLPSGFPLESN